MATSARGKKSTVTKVKTSLDNPYGMKWNTVVGDDMQFILKTLQEKFKQLGLQKIEPPRKFLNRKRKGTLKDNRNPSDASTKELEEIGSVDEKESYAGDATQKPGWTNVDLRKELAIGINEVTRALEKDELYLVLVCKSAKPEMITLHLIELSASRAVPACQVPRLSENLAPVLGLKSVLALGFRTKSINFDEEVKAIKERVPLNVSWISQTTLKNKIISSASPEEPTSEAMEEGVLNRNLKRKQDEKSVDSTVQSSMLLQPLKIKKLVPNPNKVRKPPKIKKTVSKK